MVDTLRMILASLMLLILHPIIPRRHPDGRILLQKLEEYAESLRVTMKATGAGLR